MNTPRQRSHTTAASAQSRSIDSPKGPHSPIARPDKERKFMKRALVLIMPFGLILMFTSSSLRKADADTHSLHDNWSWLQDTYWYVPEENLPAVETTFSPLAHQLISDQTVWHIEQYSK